MNILGLNQSVNLLGSGYKYAKVEGFKGGFSVSYYVCTKTIQGLHDLLAGEEDLFGAHIWWERGDKMMFAEPGEHFCGRRYVVLSKKVVKVIQG